MSRARLSLLLSALAVVVTVATAACVIGPKHDDPSSAPATPGDAGFTADTGIEPSLEVGGPPEQDAADPLDTATPPDAPPVETGTGDCTSDAADACSDAAPDAESDAIGSDADDPDGDAASDTESDAASDAVEAGG